MFNALWAEDEDNFELADKLYGFEIRLREACGPLQEAGSRKMYGEKISSNLKFTIANTAQECREQIRLIQDEIQKLNLDWGFITK